MPWIEKSHRCLRPTLDQVEKANAGIGSRWMCPLAECRRVHRITNFELESHGLSVRWEIER